MTPELEKKLILPPAGARVLCAVSGGADSMCLLALLRELGRYELAAAHFEHGIRAEESLRDCAFVEDCCRAQEIPCFTEHADVPAYAKEHGLGLEEAARELRYAFLEKTADERGYDWIATAHNALDNAETVLFNLARGAGAKGLSGIPSRRGRIIRPLLGLTRAEIEALLTERGVPHVEDSSNGSDFCSRNRIRHAVVPVLREINPAFEEAAARTSRQLRRDEDFLDSLARDFLAAHFDGESLSAKELLILHEAVSSRVVRMLADRSLEEKHVSAVLALCRGTERRELDVPGAHFRCERGRLYLDGGEPEEIAARPVPREGSVSLPEAKLTIRCRPLAPGEEIHSPFKTYFLKYESICGDLSVSAPRAGEKYRPAGRGCTKTLKSLFAEARFTQRDRRLTPVLRDQMGVVLVPPFGISERCAAEDGERLLAVTIEKEE